MSKLAVSIEGFIATELRVRDVTGHRVVDVTVPYQQSKQDEAGVWQRVGDTEWFKATFWDEHADAVMMTVEKGSLVTLTGSLKTSIYTTKDGNPAVSLQVTNPVLALVVKRPKRGESAAVPRASVEQVWHSPAALPDAPAASEPWALGDEQPF